MNGGSVLALVILLGCMAECTIMAVRDREAAEKARRLREERRNAWSGIFKMITLPNPPQEKGKE